MDVLIIGGTRNLGHQLSLALLAAGHRVTVLNRGRTADELPASVTRLRADRGDAAALKTAIGDREFDAVIDTALYNGPDAQAIVELLTGRINHYLFFSTGQVYLVRENLTPPFVESDYAGAVMPAPSHESRDYEEWLYGAEKRDAEDVLAGAWATNQFPYTTLRLPMVNSERDHFHRTYGYIKRLQDGGPLLLPAGPHLPLRHIYGADVVQAILTVLAAGPGTGRSYNISQDETVSLDGFLTMLAELTNTTLRLCPVDKAILNERNLIPDCSPFSDPWMSILDNQLSKTELGIRYTPLADYLERLVAHYRENPVAEPKGYERRQEELALAAALGWS
ncbi:MAG: NAD-dependent epimerase/dehydratase family protein [Anaerolineales bacterium]|nr:NAD-dependent epimerase/dehydratase family protein [Anaerolineales bacterium]